MSTVVAPITTKRVNGGSFLIEDITAADIFTLEDLTDEQKQIAQTTADFAEKQILPNVDAIEEKHFDVTRGLLKHAGDLGLMSVDVPEEYGGP